MNPDLKTDRADLIDGVAKAERMLSRSDVGVDVTVTPLIGRAETRGLSGFGPRVSASIPLPGDSPIRDAIRRTNDEITDGVGISKEKLSGGDWQQGEQNLVDAVSAKELLTILARIEPQSSIKPLQEKLFLLVKREDNLSRAHPEIGSCTEISDRADRVNEDGTYT